MVRVETGEADWAARVTRRVLAVPRQGRRVRVVSVEGHSGSGKSTVAERVRRELAESGEPVATLTMEDLYPGWEGLERAPELLRTWVLEVLAAHTAGHHIHRDPGPMAPHFHADGEEHTHDHDHPHEHAHAR